MIADNLDEIVKVATAAGEIAISFAGARAAVLLLAVAVRAAVVAKAALTAGTMSATGAMTAFNIAVRANPIGLMTALLGTAASAFLLFRDNADESAKRVERLTDSNKLLTESLERMSKTKAESYLLDLAEYEQRAADEIASARREIQEILSNPLAAGGLMLDTADQRHLAALRLRAEEAEKSLEAFGKRSEEIRKHLGNLEETAGKAASGIETIGGAAKLTASEMDELLEPLGLTFEELETGISSAERTTLNAFRNLTQAAGVTDRQIERAAKAAASRVRSPEAIQELTGLHELAARAVEQTSKAANKKLSETEARAARLSGLLRQMMSSGDRAARDIQDALGEAKTADDIKAIESAFKNLTAEEQAAVRSAGVYNQLIEKRRQIFLQVAEVENKSMS